MSRRLSPHEQALRAKGEEEWQDEVVDIAHAFGWWAVHYRAGYTRSGEWRTPVAYDGGGFPDLVLVRERLIAVECKRQPRGPAERERQVAPQQERWLERIRTAGTAAYVWRPEDVDTVIAVLSAVEGEEAA